MDSTLRRNYFYSKVFLYFKNKFEEGVSGTKAQIFTISSQPFHKI